MSEYRPQSLDEIVGHRHAKEKAAVAIAAALARDEPLPHCLLSSSGGGLGKTTLARVLANELYAPLVMTSGTAIQHPIDLRNLLMRLKDKAVVLLDEFHAVGRAARDELLLVLEENVINVNLVQGGPLRLDLPRFTLIAATTEPEALPAPLAQRFRLRFHLNPLEADDMKKVVQQIWSKFGIPIHPEVAADLAQRSRGIPRRALALSERVRDLIQAKRIGEATNQCFQHAMILEGIDDLGLDEEERVLLYTLLHSEPRPVSARHLALTLGVQVATITQVYEPALMRLGLLTVGPGGRRLTPEGRVHLIGAGPGPD